MAVLGTAACLYCLLFVRRTALEFPIKYLWYTKCPIEFTERNLVETHKCAIVFDGIKFLALQFVDHKSGSRNVCLYVGVSQKVYRNCSYVTGIIGAKTELLQVTLKRVAGSMMSM